MLCSFCKAYPFKRLFNPVLSFALLNALIDERKLNIFLRGKLGDKVKALKYKADLSVSYMRQLVFRVSSIGIPSRR